MKGIAKGEGWLLFFYTVPSKPVSSRMRVWRRLMKAGAAQLKGAVYILPDTDEHYEFLQWLISEIDGMKGEGAFARVDRIDTMKDSEIIAHFNDKRESDYQIVEKKLDVLERKLNSIRKGARVQNIKGMSDQIDRLIKDFEEIRKIDFFHPESGGRLSERIKSVKGELTMLSGTRTKKEVPIVVKKLENYEGKIWVTRKRPFIDRMASAWLIKRFIDRKAAFGFIDEKEVETLDKNSVAFDIQQGEFTHSGDMCTFEVLIRAFGLRDKVLRKMAEIVHDLDIRDDKYKAAEATGLEDILTGIRKSAKDDIEALEKGIAVFEMLYISKSR